MTAVVGDEKPVSAREFIGRHAELSRVRALWSAGARLVTLVGPGGIGKTRVASESLRTRPVAEDRVHWVRLARLRRDADSLTIADELARAIAPSAATSSSTWDALTVVLADVEPTMLVLDNCEHVRDGLWHLVGEILDVFPTVSILATSREPIGWGEENLVTIGPLSARNALELFCRRAAKIGHSVGKDPVQRRTAAEICRHVDNNPLFISLASAQLRQHPLEAVLRELSGTREDRRLSWRVGEQPDLEERHQRVRDVIAWSYALCSPREQLLLERLSIFAAGYETDRAEADNGADLYALIAVCADDTLPGDEIELLLERLVEQSLVCTHFTGESVRYYVLESVRVYARECLDHRDGEAARELARRHLRHHRDRVLAGQAAGFGPEERHWLRWIRSAWDNLLTAIETSLLDPEEAVVGLQTATVLMTLRIPFLLGANRALTQLTERALAATRGAGPGTDALRLHALAMVAWVAMWQGRTDYTEELLDECIMLAAPGRGLDWRERTAPDLGLPPLIDFTRGLELMLVHRDPRAITVFDLARGKYAAANDLFGDERSQLFAAFASAFVGTRAQALDNTAANLQRALDSGSLWSTGWAELARAVALTKHGYPDQALDTARSALSAHLVPGDIWTENFAVLARIIPLIQILDERMVSTHDTDLWDPAVEIACLAGGFITKHHFIGIASDRVPLIANEIERGARVATAVLGPEAYAAAERVGVRFVPDSDELLRYALGTYVPAGLPDRDGARMSRWSLLSDAESEVGVLVAAGWSNPAIAGRRGVSVRTVDKQVDTIRQKLMLASRKDVGTHVPDDLGARVQLETVQRPPRSRRGH